MARDFCERFASAREAFAEASEALNLDLKALCFGDDPRLDLTEHTQPAILTAEIAMLRALATEFGFAPGLFGGHSLGEYTALCAAGVLPLADAVRIVRQRGALMQSAAAPGAGAMVAVVAKGVAERDLAGAIGELEVDVANRNSADQVVLSGATSDIGQASRRVAELLGGTRHDIVPLNVSALCTWIATLWSMIIACLRP